jgi:N,N'-diacetyllegionaminate synthase
MLRGVSGFAIGARIIGALPTYVIAEAGVNHDGEASVAHALVDAAADAGADAVKFQTFDPDALVTSGAPLAPYQAAAASGLDERASDQREMLRRLALPLDAWPALQRHALDRGIAFLSTPFDEGSADLLDRLDVPAFKVGSGDLTDLPFLERLARRGRPLLVSTGMATMAEVAEAVDAIKGAGDPPLVLLHCVSSYPASPSDANLRAIGSMREAFGVPVGWSDHSPGIEVAVAATALGAAVVEKHLTLGRDRPGPDHRSSLEPDVFATLVQAVRLVCEALGDGVKRPVPAEAEIALVARRSLHWARAVDRGEIVVPDDVVVLRPATGLAPKRIADVIGRRTARAVLPGAAIETADLDGFA